MIDQHTPTPEIRNRWPLLVLVALGLMVTFLPLPATATAQTERTIKLDARRFEYHPDTIKVNPGDLVTIELTADDVVHGLVIDGYGILATAEPGMTTRISFTADRQGTFRFHCTVPCGNMHPFMTGKLEVGQNLLLWRAAALTGLVMVAAVWMRSK